MEMCYRIICRVFAYILVLSKLVINIIIVIVIIV